MTKVHLYDKPAFTVAGMKTWIAGIEDSQAFGRFWAECQENGLFKTFEALRGSLPGPVTNGMTLGISRVEANPSHRSFFYMIAVEVTADSPLNSLEIYQVPAARWAAFECWGKMPESIIAAEMIAFGEWLSGSGYAHAPAPEMEVYSPQNPENSNQPYCEFWLPVIMV